MLVTMKSSELVDKLIVIAEGDFELVKEAIEASAKGADGAELKDVVAYIVKHRQKVAAA